MELSVAANYDIRLIPELCRYPVSDVYGKLSGDIVGGGRAAYSSGSITFRHLKQYIAALKEHGIGFSYLLNSACLANHEWDGRWQKKFFRFVEKLQSANVRRLTVSTPLLFKIIRKSFPQFYLKVGIFAQVDTPRRARYWQDLGADEITLESFSINRDFKRLLKIRQSVSCRLQLIANHPCLPNCAMQVYHQNGLSHASNGSRQLFIDYCFLTCSDARLKDPSLFIQSQWIRPEDLTFYEDLGFDRFKLLERSIPSAQLLKRVRAYSRRQSPPNLAELILPYGFPEKSHASGGWLLRHFFKPFQIQPTRLKPIYQLVKEQGMLFNLKDQKIFIDTTQIPSDFLMQINRRDCAMTDCQTCGYCREIADNAVRIDPAFRRRILDQYEQVNRMITTGELWDV